MKRILISLSMIALVVGVVVAVTGAWFSDTASNTDNVFTAGTVDIALAPATTLLTAGNMAPGDSVAAPLTVTNSGSLELRYAMVENLQAGSAALEAELWQTIAEPGFDATCGTADDVIIYTGTLQDEVIGDPAQGAQAGDRVLVDGGSEVLCWEVGMPTTADNTFQGLTTTVRFDFSAEQTANNP